MHHKNQTAVISSEQCVREIKNRNKDYKKGAISLKLGRRLREHQIEAIKRAKQRSLYNNPSSSIYLLLEKLSELKGE